LARRVRYKATCGCSVEICAETTKFYGVSTSVFRWACPQGYAHIISPEIFNTGVGGAKGLPFLNFPRGGGDSHVQQVLETYISESDDLFYISKDIINNFVKEGTLQPDTLHYMKRNKKCHT